MDLLEVQGDAGACVLLCRSLCLTLVVQQQAYCRTSYCQHCCRSWPTHQQHLAPFLLQRSLWVQQRQQGLLLQQQWMWMVLWLLTATAWLDTAMRLTPCWREWLKCWMIGALLQLRLHLLPTSTLVEQVAKAAGITVVQWGASL
jgi:hypothetical protein